VSRVKQTGQWGSYKHRNTSVAAGANALEVPGSAMGSGARRSVGKVIAHVTPEAHQP
jgi:hypothetical protein